MAGEIQYRLHKDNSFIGQGYKTPEEKVNHLKQLKKDGYVIDKIVDYEEEAHKVKRNNYYEWLLKD
jgi:hypothetical protein